MSTIVVQGQPVVADTYQTMEAQPVGGQPLLHEKQPPQFRDSIWALLFFLHFIPLVFYALFYSGSNDGGGGDGTGFDLTSNLFWLGITSLVAVGLATFSLEGMMRFAQGLVKTALIFSVIFSLLIAVFFFVTGNVIIGALGLVSFAIGVCYAKLVWHRIPFASSTMRTALTAVRGDMGLIFVAYFFMAIAFGWSILFFLGAGSAMNSSGLPVIFLFFVSYYWTHQVLQNTVHVTVAGVIGTWWHVPSEVSSCMSPALRDSFFRATTYSFGSICLGSLLVALVRALRATIEYARGNDDLNFLVCILQCILGCLESIIEYLNKWAYVYVGLYGFSYLDAGREVINLFQQRGWTVIIADDLVDNVMFMMSLAIGLAAGLTGFFIGQGPLLASGADEETAGMMAFGIAFLIGFMFASIALGVVSSAVNTVLVCYCESPREFESNHPELSAEMRSNFAAAWPELSL